MGKERIVCIEWEDAASNPGYYDKGDPERFLPIFTRSVGHLVKSTPKTIIISQDRFYLKGKIDDDRHISIIPKKMIKRIFYLTEGS